MKSWLLKGVLGAAIVSPEVRVQSTDHEGRIVVSRRFKSVALSTVSLAAIALVVTPVSATSSCEGLVNLSLPGAVVTAAQSVAGGNVQHTTGLYYR